MQWAQVALKLFASFHVCANKVIVTKYSRFLKKKKNLEITSFRLFKSM